MTVNDSRTQAIVGWYRILNTPNPPYTRLRLTGLDPNRLYRVREDDRFLGEFYGDELMNAGLITSDSGSGEALEGRKASCDFESRIYVLE